MRPGTAALHACAATRSPWRSPRRWLLLLACLALAPLAGAATATWNGAGGDDNWSTGGNWVGGAAPSPGDDLVFAGGSRLTPNDDFGAGTAFASITFDATAGAFTIGGNRVTITGAITNNSSSGETLTCDISGTYGVAGSSGAITLSGGLGTNGLLTKTGSHTLTLSGTTDNVGFGLTANAGTLILAKTSSSNVHAIGGATLTVNGATVKLGGTGGDQLYDDATILVNSGTFDTNGRSEAFNTLSGAGTIDNTGGGASVLTIGQTGGGSGISGVIRNSSGTLAMVKAGTGTMVLSGTNTYSGGTTITGGKISYPSDAALAGTGAITLNGGTLLHTGVSTLANAFSVTASSGIESDDGDDLTLTGSSIAGTGGTTLSLVNTSNANCHSLILSGSGFTYAGNISVDSNSQVLFANTSGTQTFSGVISGTGNGSGVDGAVKRNAAGGVTTLAGANTYTGTTLVSAGTLAVTGSTASGSAVSITSGGTLSGTGTVAGAVGVASGGIIAPGVAVSPAASFVATSLRAVTQDDWRLTQTIAGTRTDLLIDQAGNAFGSGAERAAYGISGNDGDWDNFSVQWDGYLQVPVGGTTLYTRSDDGSRVWLDLNGDGLVEANEWGSNGWGTGQAETTRAVQATLAAGSYRMRVQYEEGNGGDAMHLLWDDAAHSAGTIAGLQVVPATFLTGGSSIGTLTTGAVTCTGTPVLALDLDGTTPTADLISSSGTVACGGGLSVSSIAHAALGKVYTIISAGTVTGTFTGLANGAKFASAGRTFQIAYTGTTVTLTDVAHPTTRTWDGGGADDNWTTAANWDLDIAPQAGDDLVFAGSTRLTPNNDFPPETTFASITFSAGAGAFVIGPTAVGTGSISRQVWTGIGGNAVALIPVGVPPDISDTFPTFEGPTNWADSYGTRMRGFLTAPTTGTYTFWLATDDEGELWLSTDADPAHKALIASITNGSVVSENWFLYPSQKSVGIALVAGQRYYIEALQKEGIGGDDIAVGWARPGESTAGPSQVIPGSQLSPYTSAVGITLAGGITNSSGALQTLNLGLNVAATRTVLCASGTVAIGGIVGGAGGLTKTGAGALALSGANVLTGGVGLSAGTLAINSPGALGSGTLTIAGGTTIDNTSGGPVVMTAGNPQSWAGDFTFTGSSALDLGRGAVDMGGAGRQVTVGASTLTVGGAVGGTGGVTKAGAGTLALGGACTYGGATVVSAGTLQLLAFNVLSASPARNWIADSLTASPVTAWADALAGRTAVTDNAAPTLVAAAVNGHKAVAFNGSTQDLVVGAGDNPISGTNAFTIAVVFVPAAGGAGGAGQWYQNSGLVDAEQGGVTNDWGLTWNGSAQVAAGIGNPDSTAYSAAVGLGVPHLAIASWNGTTGLVTLNVDGATTTLATSATAARNSFQLLMGRTSNGGAFFNGQIAAIEMFTTALSSTDVIALGQALAATYGVTTSFPVPNGALPTGTALSIAAGATLDLDGRNQEVASLADQGGGGGNVTNSGTSAVALTVSGSAATSFSGTISDGATSACGLTRTGTGTLTLSGTNTYTGATTVSAGTLLVTGATAAGSGVTVASGGTLGGSGAVAGGVTLQAGGVLAPGTGGSTVATLATGPVTGNATSIFSVDLNGTGPVADRCTSSGTVACAGTLTVASIVNAAAGRTYTIASGSAVSGAFSGLANGATFAQQARTFQIIYGATAVTLVDATSVAPATRTWDGGGGDNRWTTAANWVGDVTPLPGDDLVFAGATRLAPDDDFATDTSFASISFANGAGAFTLGSTLGLRVALAGALTNNGGALQTVNLPVLLAATRTVNAASGDLAVTSVLSGAGGLTKTGTGTLTLSQNNTFTGLVTVSAGTLATTTPNSASGAVGAASGVLISSGGTVSSSISNGLVGFTTSGAKTIQIDAGGVLTTAPGATSHLHALVLNGGTLAGNAGNPTWANWNLDFGVSTLGGGTTSTISGGDIALTQSGGTTFTIATGDTVAVASAIAHASSAADNGLIKAGAGTLTLSGANTYTSATTVSAGTLRAGVATQAFGVGSVVTVANAAGATLDLAGFSNTIGSLAGGGVTGGAVALGAGVLTMGGSNADTTFSGVISGTGGTTKTGSGTMTFAGTVANTNSGTTTIADGTLVLQKTAGVNAIAGNITIGDTVGTDVLRLGADNQIADSAVITFTSGLAGNSAKLDLNGFVETVAGIQSSSADQAAVIQNTESGAPAGATNPAVLTIANTVDCAYDGLVRDGGSGSIALVKAGSGTLTLRCGFDNHNVVFSGGVSLTAGRLVLADLVVFASAIADTSAAADALTFAQGSRDMVFSAGISGSGAVTKTGAGTLTLSGTDAATGATTVGGGSLLVTGTTAAASAVTVASGGTLGGTGTVAGSVTVAGGGTLAPGTGGTSIGTLTTGAVTGTTSATFSVDLDGTSPSSDRVASAGAVTRGGALTVASIANAAVGKVYTIITSASAGGTFSGLADGAVFAQAGRLFRIAYTATTVTLTDCAPLVTARQTIDLNGDGHLDRIRLTFDQAVNDDFSAFTVAVTGYAVTGYDTGATGHDASIDVLLTPLAGGDTGATPPVQIVANGSLKQAAGAGLIQVEGAATTAADGAAPVLLSAAWSDGGAGGVGAGDTVTLTFSEPVTTTGMTVADIGLPVTGDALSTTTIADQAGATISMTLAGTPHLTPGGTYSAAATASGKASGVFIAAGGRIRDAVALAAATGSAAAAVDLAPGTSSVAIAWSAAADPQPWALGTLTVGTVANSRTSGLDLTVRDTGDCTVDLAIASAATAPSSWTPAAAAGANAYLMKADASGASVAAPSVAASYALTLGTTPQALASGLQSGSTATYALYFQAPTSITGGSTTQQTIVIAVTAALAP